MSVEYIASDLKSFPPGILFKPPAQAFLFCFTTFLNPFLGPHHLKYLSLFYHYLKAGTLKPTSGLRRVLCQPDFFTFWELCQGAIVKRIHPLPPMSQAEVGAGGSHLLTPTPDLAKPTVV